MSPGGSESLPGDGPDRRHFAFWCSRCPQVVLARKRQKRCPSCGGQLSRTIPDPPAGEEWPLKVL
jgi:rRNA maturation endonuclease Nob1